MKKIEERGLNNLNKEDGGDLLVEWKEERRVSEPCNKADRSRGKCKQSAQNGRRKHCELIHKVTKQTISMQSDPKIHQKR